MSSGTSGSQSVDGLGDGGPEGPGGTPPQGLLGLPRGTLPRDTLPCSERSVPRWDECVLSEGYCTLVTPRSVDRQLRLIHFIRAVTLIIQISRSRHQ